MELVDDLPIEMGNDEVFSVGSGKEDGSSNDERTGADDGLLEVESIGDDDVKLPEWLLLAAVSEWKTSAFKLGAGE